MVVYHRLTAESFIEVPKRSPVVPDYNGEFGLYTVSTHKVGRGTTKEVRVMEFATKQSTKLSDDPNVHDARWIPGTNDIVYLKSRENGRTRVYHVKGFGTEHIRLGEFDAALSNLKLKALDDGTVVFMVAGLADADGILYNEAAQSKPDSGRLFKTYNVRMVSIDGLGQLNHDIDPVSGTSCIANSDLASGTTCCVEQRIENGLCQKSCTTLFLITTSRLHTACTWLARRLLPTILTFRIVVSPLSAETFPKSCRGRVKTHTHIM